MKRLVRRMRRGEKGQALVEFALILPLLCVFIFALADFGRAFHAWLLVTNAAREGARAGATQQPLSAIQNRVNSSLGGLDNSDLTISVTNAQGPRGESLEVDLTYDFEFVTPLGGLLEMIGGDNLSAPAITGHSSMRLE